MKAFEAERLCDDRSFCAIGGDRVYKRAIRGRQNGNPGLVLGAGRIGAAIVYDLLRSRGVAQVGVADKDRNALVRVARQSGA